MDETEWIGQLGEYLDGIVKLRVIYVEAWISANLQRFKASNANVELLQRDMANSVVELQANVEMCKATCALCHLKYTLSRRHDPTQRAHSCNTNHQCPRICDYNSEHLDELRSCQYQ